MQQNPSILLKGALSIYLFIYPSVFVFFYLVDKSFHPLGV